MQTHTISLETMIEDALGRSIRSLDEDAVILETIAKAEFALSVKLEERLGKARFRKALQNAPKSHQINQWDWTWWHVRLELTPVPAIR